MTNDTNNKPTRIEQDTKAMNGVDLHLASAGTMTIGGEQFTPATLKAVFQADIDATNDTDAAKTTLKQKVLTAQTARKRAAGVRKNLKVFLVGQNGPAAVQVLEDFGFTVPKAPGPKTVEAKAAGQQKAQVTRQKQKAAKAAAETPPPPATPAAK
jgi:predicted Fe-Mo cluster-binding NifX family protein